MTAPLVTAVMVTGKDPARVGMAVAAVKSFQLQTYTNKNLLIVTDGSSPLDYYGANDPQLSQIHVAQKLTLGTLRNLCLEYATGEFIIQWDDDDWSHPDRIRQQVERALVTGGAVTLGRQIRYSFANNNAFVCQADRSLPGIPGTILHPRTELRYPELPKHEDSHFLKSFTTVDILDNSPELYVRFHHSANTWNLRHIMRRYAAGRGRWSLPPSARTYLHQVIDEHYREKLFPQARR